MRVALEAMGDFPLEPLMAGAIAAARADHHLRITFVGHEHAIAPHLGSLGKVANRLSIVPCSQRITPDEDPARALRLKPDSSVARLWQLLMERKVDAIVTHGHPEVVLAAGLRYRRLLDRVRHPAVAAVIATQGGDGLLTGALMQGAADELYQSGVMACVAAQHLLQKQAPTIGLLYAGLGAERNAVLDETRRLFMESPYRPSFVGNVWPWDLGLAPADVVVSDVLPGYELAEVHQRRHGAANEADLGHVLPFNDPGEQPGRNASVRERPGNNSVRLVRGGFLLGMEGVCVLTFGQTDEKVIQDAMAWTTQWFVAGLNELISEALRQGPLGP